MAFRESEIRKKDLESDFSSWKLTLKLSRYVDPFSHIFVIFIDFGMCLISGGRNKVHLMSISVN